MRDPGVQECEEIGIAFVDRETRAAREQGPVDRHVDRGHVFEREEGRNRLVFEVGVDFAATSARLAASTSGTLGAAWGSTRLASSRHGVGHRGDFKGVLVEILEPRHGRGALRLRGDRDPALGVRLAEVHMQRPLRE